MAAVDVWQRQAAISRSLGAWAVGSVAAGAVGALAGQLAGRPALRAFGLQSAGWGVIDLAIAELGDLRRRQRMLEADDAADRMVQAGERAKLRRILRVNAALDVGYVGVGIAATLRGLRRQVPGQPLPAAVGHGSAVVLQGGFLLGFDLWQAARLG